MVKARDNGNPTEALLMPGRHPALRSLVCLALFLSPVLLGVSEAQPSQGNWVVTGTQVVQNESITLNGNLTIQNGGNLTLLNVNLAMNVQSNGQYRISVQSGGSLYIYDSEISSADEVHKFAFSAKGSAFVMERSTIANAGWCNLQDDFAPVCSNDSNYNGNQGLSVETDRSLISNNRITNSGIGLTLLGLHDVVKDNTIVSSNYSSVVIDYHRIGGTGTFFANHTIEGNTFQQYDLIDSAMIQLKGSGGNIIQNNTFFTPWTTTAVRVSYGLPTLMGIQTEDSWGNEIRYNNFATPGGILIHRGSNNVISSNSLTACTTSIQLADVGPGNLVVGNRIETKVCNDSVGAGESFGITLNGAEQTLVEGNNVYAFGKPNTSIWFALQPIWMFDTFNSFILNNNFTFYGLGWPFEMLQSSGNTIEGNTISDLYSSGREGFFLGASNNNTIVDNQVKSATYSTPSFNTGLNYSIVLDASNHDSIYGNDFFSLDAKPYDGGTSNAWSSQVGGNYWESYNGSEPYKVLPNGTDYHPLSSPVKIVPVATPSIASAPVPVPSCHHGGSMNVTNDVTMNRVSANYDCGIIDVGAGGHLTIANSNLTLGVGANSGFQVWVEKSGALSIVNSSITWGQGAVRIFSGGSVVFTGTTMTVTGTGPIDALGIEFFGPGFLTLDRTTLRSTEGSGFSLGSNYPDSSIIILNSLIDGGSANGDTPDTIKEIGYNSTLIIKDSIFEDCVGGVGVGGTGSTVEIVNSTFRNVVDPIQHIEAKSAVLLHNVFSGSLSGISLSAGNLTFEGNSLRRSWSRGIFVTGGVAHITGNNVSNTLGAGIDVRTNGGLVANNILIPSSGPAFNLAGNNNIIVGNSFYTNARTSDFADRIQGSGNTIYHNNFVEGGVAPEDSSGKNSYSRSDEGNYWSTYAGTDKDFDGIGDSPFMIGSGAQDNYPFMKPNGWLTKFYLTLETNLPPPTAFQINGTNFSVGQGSTATLRLGYVDAYTLALPQTVKLANGSALSFLRWGDGVASPMRTLKLSANSTLVATYVWEAPTTTTTSSTLTVTSSSASTTSSSSSSHASASTTTTSTSSPASGGGGGIPEFPYQPLAAAVISVLLVASYLLIRRNVSKHPI